MEKFIVISVTSEYDQSRLDRFIKKLYPALNQTIIEKSLRKKDIKLNSAKADSSSRIQEGDLVYIAKFLMNIEAPEKTKEDKQVDHKFIKLIKDSIIFEDDNLIVINKPAGIAVQGGSKIKVSIDDILPKIAKKNEKLRLVHRLDMETSGVLIIARNNKIASDLTLSFKKKDIAKTYLAITSRAPRNKKGIINIPVAKFSSEEREKKEAITHYKVLDYNKKMALIEFKPLTGRTHQIRIHAKEIGCPILGDDKYGTNDDQYQNLCLHSYSITLPEGIYINSASFRAEIPKYFKDILDDNMLKSKF